MPGEIKFGQRTNRASIRDFSIAASHAVQSPRACPGLIVREFDLIAWIRARQQSGGNVVLPASDDLAILKFDPADLVLVGIDQVLDGVHFDSKVHAPQRIGRKVMNRNLSDCAAMACLPVAAVVSVALPRGIDIDFVKSLYIGMEEAGKAFGCRIVGGDTGSWDQKLAVSVAITGCSAGVPPIRRSGAKPGDHLYVTGPLGGSILGRHLDFVPRVREARELATTYRITAMIDISDGLSRDLGHLCAESAVGAEVDAGSVPIHDDVARLPADSHSPLEHALHDGEDHELCFTSPDVIPGAIRIGRVTQGKAIELLDRGQRMPLAVGGFEHQF
jgi:thiamine-monophosphate kinase